MGPKYLLISISFLILYYSCSNDKEVISANGILPLHSNNYLVTMQGDTIPAGIPIPVTGNEVNTDSLAVPRKVPLKSAPEIEVAHSNVFPIGEVRTIAIPHDLTIIAPGKDGIPLPKSMPVQGKVVQSYQPPSQPALSLKLHDRARFDIQCLDVEQGLSSSFVWDILQDSRGYMWFGTGTDGIVQYNGRDFTNYSTSEGLSHNTLRHMMEDSQGNLWFATDGGGVSMYDGMYFTHFTTEEGLSDNVVYSILEDNRGNIWIGTRSGLNKFDGRQITYFSSVEGLSSDVVRVLFEDHQGKLWIGTMGGGITRYDPDTLGGWGSFTHFALKEGLSGNSVRDIWEDREGIFWFATNGGVCRFDGTHFSHITTKQGLSDNEVWAISEDRWGDLWFGTRRGLNQYHREAEGAYLSHFTMEEGLSNDWITSILEDREGTLWLGTRGGGVNRYDSRSFSYPKQNKDQENNWISSTLVDQKGNLWLGTRGRGLIRYDGMKFTHYTSEQGLTNDNVSTIQEDRHGNLWVGMFGNGVDRFDGNTFTHYGSKQGLVGANIWSLLYDRNGYLWLGTWFNGVTRIHLEGEKKDFAHFTMEQGLGSNSVLSILEDSRDDIWFGTRGGGVSRYDGDNLVNFPTEVGMGAGGIAAMMEDSRGYIWLGGDGLIRYDPKDERNNAIFLTRGTVLKEYLISSILEDNDQNIWVSTHSGINVLKPIDSSSTDGESFPYAIFTFGVEDGVKNLNFFQGAASIDQRNRLWWGSVNGLTMLDLNNFDISSNVPETHLNTIEVKENFIDYRRLKDTTYSSSIAFGTALAASSDSVVPFSNYPEKLVIPAHLDHLTFHFYAIDWAASHKLKYSFMIEGLDDYWSMPGPEGKADYRNLPYGKYVFKVKAIGESKVWSEPFEYHFEILPPWWHTWWARTLYLLSGLLMISGYVRWRTYSLRKRQRELEQTVTERTAEVVAERDRSDELLLNILPSETAQELKKYGSAKAKSYDMVTVIFADFKDFTYHAERLSPETLVDRIDYCFKAFDRIMAQYQVEKIKTIGDAYMAAAGLPVPNTSNPVDAVHAALAIRDFMLQYQAEASAKGEQSFEIRIGIHSGPVVAGIVGIKKFAYDIWGDTVNLAARMESSGEVGCVNISQNTYELLKDHPDFSFMHRGKIQAKNKGELDMYFVESR